MSEAVMVCGKQFMGVREAKKVTTLLSEITEMEKAASKLLLKITRMYYDAGYLIGAAILRWDYKREKLSAKAVADAFGFPERRITLALKIFKFFEHNPDALDNLTLHDTLKLIAPPPPSGEDGYNRIDLGGDPGQMWLNFGELFELPATGNQSLQNYRTVGDMISEIIVVRRDASGGIISKCFSRFYEDVPQIPALRHAYKTMSQKTQAAIEDYLAAVEQEEEQQ